MTPDIIVIVSSVCSLNQEVALNMCILEMLADLNKRWCK